MKAKSTAEMFRESMIRLGGRPIIVDGRPVHPAKPKKTEKSGGNGSKK